MSKACIRCGYERTETDTAPDTECPQCGVIYTRVESASGASRQAASLRLAQAVREQRVASKSEGVQFVAFRTMYTPLLLRIAFLAAVVLGVAAAILAFASGEIVAGVGALLAILVARLLLEGMAVIFKIANDLDAVRGLLTEQAVINAREAAKPL